MATERRSIVLVDGENIDGTLGGIVDRRSTLRNGPAGTGCSTSSRGSRPTARCSASSSRPPVTLRIVGDVASFSDLEASCARAVGVRDQLTTDFGSRREVVAIGLSLRMNVARVGIKGPVSHGLHCRSPVDRLGFDYFHLQMQMNVHTRDSPAAWPGGNRPPFESCPQWATPERTLHRSAPADRRRTSRLTTP